MKFKKGKKRTAEIMSVREAKEVFGIFEGIEGMYTMDNEPVLNRYDQQLHTISLVNPETGEIQKYWADGGIRGAVKLAKVKKGDTIVIQHTGEKEIDEGVVQTYDIFEATL